MSSIATEMAHNALVIRNRLRYPPNAKIDRGIALGHPMGITGRLLPVKMASKPIAVKTSGRDWMIVSTANLRADKFPPYFFDDIMNEVSRYFLVSKADIVGPKRHKAIVRPRQIVVYFARRFTTRSYSQIMKKLGDRDHTCGVNSLKVINKLCQTDDKIKSSICVLTAILEQKIAEWRAAVT